MNPIFDRAIRSASWKLLLYASNFILTIILSRHYGAAGSAPLFYLLNNLAVAVLFISFGLDNSVSYFYSKNLMDKGQLLKTSLVWSGVATVLFAAFIQTFPSFNLELPGLEAGFVYAYVFGAVLSALVAALYYAAHNSMLPNLLPGLLNTGFVVYIFVAAPEQSAGEAYYAIRFFFVIPLITACILFIIQCTTIDRFVLKQKLWTKAFIGYSAHVFIATLVLGIFARCDVWMVAAFCDATQLGNYIQTLKFGQLALMVPLLASFSLFPLFTQNLEAGTLVHNTVLQLSNIYFYIVGLFCILIGFSGFWLFPLVYGSSFMQMPLLFVLAAPGLTAFAASYPFVSFFGAANKNSIIIQVAAESVLMLVITGFVLLMLLQVHGAAISYSIANIYFAMRFFFLFNTIHAVPIKRFFAPKAFTTNIRMLIKSI